MEPALVVVLLVLLFAGTHVGLATRSVRGWLVARLGERGFVGLFSLVASLSFAALIAYCAAHRFDGAPGLAAGAVPAVHAVLVAAIAAGFALAAAGLAAYPRMPMALFGQAVAPPRGIERVTRHPFFAGTALVGVAHALLATRLVGALLMAGLAALSLIGAWHQDRKFLRARGRAYADYLAVTSMLPFGAILAGRQHLVWRELPFGALAAGVATAWLVRLVHATLFAGGGLWLVLAVVGGAAVATVQSWRAARRRTTRAALQGARVS